MAVSPKPGERVRIIAPEMLPGPDGANINGPSCIEVPAWIENPLGRYYLYFAHHAGGYIRLAYSDEPAGPWTIHPGGVLPVGELAHCRGHIASPDAVIDEASRTIRLYYHAVELGSPRQRTWLATSSDGLAFVSSPEPLADFYLRMVPWRDRWVGMSKGGVMYLSPDGLGRFKRLPAPAFLMTDPQANAPGDVRHVALKLEGDRLWVLFTYIGDAPEHIRLGYVDLLRAISRWKVDDHVALLVPQEEWEGVRLALSPSRMGAAERPERALRDPAVLETAQGTWLFYACAGEHGIGVTRLPDLGAWYMRQAGPSRHRKAAIAKSLKALEQPGALAAALAKLDRETPRRRIYLMGCGRSGTWLLTTLMTGFAEIEVVPEELDVEWFALRETDKPTLLLKRSWAAHQRIDAIPDSVRLLYIVRHPFDVLTSKHPAFEKRFYIEPERWIGEMQALRALVESGDARLVTVRYEDLVTDADAALARIAEAFGLAPASPADEIMQDANVPAKVNRAMHGIRAVDDKSVERFRNDPEGLERLREITPGMSELLAWTSRQFGYDTTLP